MDIFVVFLKQTGFASMSLGNAIMILIGIAFIMLAITKDYEPLLLVPIGMGAIVGNIPVIDSMALSVYDSGSVLSYLYFGVSQGVYPPLIFLGIGAMTDFSTMLSNPKLVLLGAAAQIGVFLTFLARSGSASPWKKAPRSESSVARTAQRRFFWPQNSHRTCSVRSPLRPIRTWLWYR